MRTSNRGRCRRSCHCGDNSKCRSEGAKSRITRSRNYCHKRSNCKACVRYIVQISVAKLWIFFEIECQTSVIIDVTQKVRLVDPIERRVRFSSLDLADQRPEVSASSACTRKKAKAASRSPTIAVRGDLSTKMGVHVTAYKKKTSQLWLSFEMGFR
jgi:hypothetical protein